MRATVYFGNDLSREAIKDDGIRAETLSQGIRLVSSVPGVEVLREMDAACAAAVRGSEKDILELEETLVQLGGGRLVIDDPRHPPFPAA